MDVAPRFKLLTLLTMFILFKPLYTAKTMHVCLYILLGKVRMLLEWPCGKCAKSRAPAVLAMDNSSQT